MAIIPELAGLEALIQDNLLEKVYHDALWPDQLFRKEARVEPPWNAHEGDVKVKTRDSLLTPIVTPTPAGVDATPSNSAKEQWSVQACQYDNSSDVQMPSSRAALASLYMQKQQTLGLNAGQSLNRIVRNKLFVPYNGGQTHTDNAATGVSLIVGSINGFTTVITGGQVTPVSAGSPLSVTIGGSDVRDVIAAVPLDTDFPLGAGTLTISASVTFSAGDTVVASDSPTILYAGGSTSSDEVLATDGLTLALVRQAVANLRANAVPPHPDGAYHIHVDPFDVSALYDDTEFRQVNETRFDSVEYTSQVIKMTMGAVFYSNNECPSFSTVNAAGNQLGSDVSFSDRPDARFSSEVGSDITNKAGVQLLRSIVTGGGAIYEEWVPENEYLTDAGVTGSSGSRTNFTTNSIQVDTDRIRFTTRAPLDRKQQSLSCTWSFTGDWGIPTDILTGRSNGRFKRAVTIVTGTSLI